MSSCSVGDAHGDRGRRGGRVLDDVGERLLHDPVRRQRDRGVEPRHGRPAGPARRRARRPGRPRPARAGRRGPASGGRVPSSVSSRSMPSIDLVCSSAWRLVSAMTSSARSAAAGSVWMTWAPTPACTAISDMLCATTSWSSRAMRSRSSVTAASQLVALLLAPRPDRVPERPRRRPGGRAPASRSEVRGPARRAARARTKHSDPDPEPDQRVAAPAVGGQRVEAEQHQHGEQADVVTGQVTTTLPATITAYEPPVAAPAPGQRPGGRHSGDRRDEVRVLEPWVEGRIVSGEQRGQRRRCRHDPDGGVEVRVEVLREGTPVSAPGHRRQRLGGHPLTLRAGDPLRRQSLDV